MSLLEGFQANWGSTLKKTLVIDGAWYKYDNVDKNLAPENFFFEISIILLTIGIFDWGNFPRENILSFSCCEFLSATFYNWTIKAPRPRPSEYVLYLAVWYFSQIDGNVRLHTITKCLFWKGFRQIWPQHWVGHTTWAPESRSQTGPPIWLLV